VEEIESGRYDGILGELCEMGEDELRQRYIDREPEPLESTGWEPKEKTYL